MDKNNMSDETQVPLIQNVSKVDFGESTIMKDEKAKPKAQNGDTSQGSQPDTPSEKTDQLIVQVENRLEETELEKQKSSETTSLKKLLLTHADRQDKILMTIGFTIAILNGFALPSFVFIFGDIIDSFGGKESD